MKHDEIQDLFDVPNGGKVYIPNGNHWIDDTINVREKWDITVEFESMKHAAIRTSDAFIYHARPMFDLSGTYDSRWFGGTVEQAGAGTPGCAILQARSPSKAASRVRFANVMTNGTFEIASWINVAAEVCDYAGCEFRSGRASEVATERRPSGPCFSWSQEPPDGLWSPHGDIEGGSHGCLTFVNCSCQHYAQVGHPICFLIDGGHVFTWDGGSWSLKNAPGTVLDWRKVFSARMAVSFEGYSADFLKLRDRINFQTMDFSGSTVVCKAIGEATSENDYAAFSAMVGRLMSTADWQNAETGKGTF